MKFYLLTVSCLIISALAPKSIQAQIYTKGDLLVEGYYGTPSNMSAVFNGGNMFKLFQNDRKSKQIGRLGLNVEYLLNKYFAIGFDVSYYHYQYDQTTPHTEVIYNGEFIPYTYNFNRWSPLIKVTCHFIQRKSVDIYGFTGFGRRYSNRVYEYHSSTSPSVKEEKIYPSMGFAVGIGAHYYVTPRIGFHLNVTYGTSAFLNAGVAYRISTRK